eukprot:COSAG04_NODE_5045_length_1765_cov_1.162665_2_plen_143_part_00
MGRYSESFFEELRDGKVNGQPLPDVVSTKSTARARKFLQLLDPPVELREELTVKSIVSTLLSYQAILLHFENDAIDSLESIKLARVDSSHGKQAKNIARGHVAQTCAQRIANVVRRHAANAEPEPELMLDAEPLSRADGKLV